MRRLLCVMLGMLVIYSQLLAQNRTISGKVTDEKGNPIVGASVLIKGTGNGTSTNDGGDFSMTSNQASPTLVISAIGYGTIEIKAGDTPVAVSLKPHEADGRAHREVENVDVEGTLRVRDLEAEYGIELPADAGFETLAGFLLFRLGAIPAKGDTVLHDGRRFTVLEMDRNRIARVRIEKLPEAPG